MRDHVPPAADANQAQLVQLFAMTSLVKPVSIRLVALVRAGIILLNFLEVIPLVRDDFSASDAPDRYDHLGPRCTGSLRLLTSLSRGSMARCHAQDFDRGYCIY